MKDYKCIQIQLGSTNLYSSRYTCKTERKDFFVKNDQQHTLNIGSITFAYPQMTNLLNTDHLHNIKIKESVLNLSPMLELFNNTLNPSI